MRCFRGACAVLLFLTTASLAAAAQDCEVTVGWETWAPYQVAGENGPEGLDIELVRRIAARAGCEVEFKRMPWARLLKSIQRGDIDGAMAAARNAERAAYAYFTKPYRNETVGLMVRKSDEAIRDMDSLREIVASGREIGMWRDYYYGETVEALKSDPETADGFRVMDQGTTLLRMLAAGRFDAVLGDPVADTDTAKDLGITDKIRVHDLTVYRTPVHLMLSKKSVGKATVNRIDEAISAARSESELSRIVARYIAE